MRLGSCVLGGGWVGVVMCEVWSGSEVGWLQGCSVIGESWLMWFGW